MSLPLLHSPADVLRQLLVSAGTGSDPDSGGAWPAHAHTMPDLPDDLLFLRDAGGVVDGRAMVSGEVFDRGGVRLFVRAANYTTGYAFARDLFTLLTELATPVTVTVEGATYLVTSVTRLENPRRIGTDGASKRHVLTFGCFVTMKRTA